MSQFEMFRHESSRAHRAGEVVFAKGDAAASLYVVAEGEVEIRIGDTVLERLGPGGVFGEMALVAGEPRSAAAVAATDCRIVEIPEKRCGEAIRPAEGGTRLRLCGIYIVAAM